MVSGVSTNRRPFYLGGKRRWHFTHGQSFTFDCTTTRGTSMRAPQCGQMTIWGLLVFLSACSTEISYYPRSLTVHRSCRDKEGYNSQSIGTRSREMDDCDGGERSHLSGLRRAQRRAHEEIPRVTVTYSPNMACADVTVIIRARLIRAQHLRAFAEGGSV